MMNYQISLVIFSMLFIADMFVRLAEEAISC